MLSPLEQTNPGDLRKLGCCYTVSRIEMRYKSFVFLCVLLFIDFFVPSHTLPQENRDSLSASPLKTLTLVETVMCEEIKDYTPQNRAIVFSIGIGRVSCFTSFDPVPEKTFIYHNWFHRDKLSTKIKLFLQPPRWSTFSGIQLREADKGPWRLEITDQEGNTLHVLRFSITD